MGMPVLWEIDNDKFGGAGMSESFVFIGICLVVSVGILIANLLTLRLNFKLYTEYFKDMSAKNRK